jgi:uncharacterized membrane protein YdbT with pleckstrin-like domain
MELKMDFMNAGWRSYLKAGDKVLSHVQTSESLAAFKAFLWCAVLTVVLCFAALVEGLGLGVLAMCAAISIFGGILIYARARSFHFVLTQSGIYSIGGLISKTARFVAYNRVTDAAVTRGILDQIFNSGSVGVSTAGGTKSLNGYSEPYEIVVRNVSEYCKIRQDIFKKIK